MHAIYEATCGQGHLQAKLAHSSLHTDVASSAAAVRLSQGENSGTHVFVLLPSNVWGASQS